MGEDGNKSEIVRVTTKGDDALSEPIFIIQVGDIYYATLSIWEYDQRKASSEEQREGVRQITHYFARNFDGDPLKAVKVDLENKLVMCATCHPHRPNAVPTSPPGVKPPRPPENGPVST